MGTYNIMVYIHNFVFHILIRVIIVSIEQEHEIYR